MNDDDKKELERIKEEIKDLEDDYKKGYLTPDEMSYFDTVSLLLKEIHKLREEIENPTIKINLDRCHRCGGSIGHHCMSRDGECPLCHKPVSFGQEICLGCRSHYRCIEEASQEGKSKTNTDEKIGYWACERIAPLLHGSRGDARTAFECSGCQRTCNGPKRR